MQGNAKLVEFLGTLDINEQTLLFGRDLNNILRMRDGINDVNAAESTSDQFPLEEYADYIANVYDLLSNNGCDGEKLVIVSDYNGGAITESRHLMHPQPSIGALLYNYRDIHLCHVHVALMAVAGFNGQGGDRYSRIFDEVIPEVYMSNTGIACEGFRTPEDVMSSVSDICPYSINVRYVTELTKA